MQGALTTLGVILFLGFGIFQLIIGYQGIEYHLGAGWAIAALACTFVFRFTLPITIGTYFGVVDVLDWHPLVGGLIAAPGLVFMVPGLALAAIEPIASFFSKKADGGKVNTSTPQARLNEAQEKEVIDTLAALEKARSKLTSEDVYASIALDDCIKEAQSITINDKENTIYSISTDGWTPSDLALLIISQVSSRVLSSGQHHVYRGVLSGHGHGYMKVFRMSVEELAKSGFITKDEAETDIAAVQRSIKAAG